MRLAAILAALLVAMGLLAPLAQGQDEVMTLNSEQLGPHERPLVIFKHQQHVDKLKCVTCHHDYDKYFNNQLEGEDGAMCSDCHGKTATAKNPLPLKEALHHLCQDCHQNLNARGSNLPVMCGQCHIRK